MGYVLNLAQFTNKHIWQGRKDSNCQPSAPKPAALESRYLASRAWDPANHYQWTAHSAQRPGVVRIVSKSRFRAGLTAQCRCLVTTSHVRAQLPHDPYV